MFKSLGSVRYFFCFIIYTAICNACIKLKVPKFFAHCFRFIFQLNAVLLNFFFYQSIPKNCIMVSTKNIKKNNVIFNIDNNVLSPDQQIRMISEGSYDTEDWSNAC